jgi:hypothetical protein
VKHLILYSLLAALALVAGCSKSQRSGDEDAGGDSGEDTDNDTGGVEPGMPIKLGDFDCVDGSGWGVRAAFSGSHVAAAWTTTCYDDPIAEIDLGFSVLPWDNPADLDWSSAASPLGEVFQLHHPFPIDSGFVLISYSAPSSLIQSTWDLAAEMTDEAHSHFGLELSAGLAAGKAPVDAEGHVLLASLPVDEGTDEPGDEVIRFQLDRFATGGYHVRLTEVELEWSAQHEQTGGVLDFVGVRGSTFEQGGAVTAVIATERGGVVIARATADGEVVQEPEVMVVCPAPPMDDPQSDVTLIGSSFAQSGELFAGVVHMWYQNGPTYLNERYTLVATNAGELVSGPTEIDSEDEWSNDQDWVLLLRPRSRRVRAAAARRAGIAAPRADLAPARSQSTRKPVLRRDRRRRGRVRRGDVADLE